MPRFVVVTVNDYHEKHETLTWRDGERHVFSHGGEFEIPRDKAVDIFHRLDRIGKPVVTVAADTLVVEEFGFGVSIVDSPIEKSLCELLGVMPDESNPSAYVTYNPRLKFRAGDLFTIGELVLAEVMPYGVLCEIDRLTLHGNASQEQHAIDRI